MRQNHETVMQRMAGRVWRLAILAGAVLLAAGVYGWSRGSDELILATTTSTQDSGLLDALIPQFEKEHDYKVKTIAVGSGEALRLAGEGEADVVLAHSPKAEEDFMAAGNGESRLVVMHNEFIIVGPGDDPAGIKGLTSAADAFKKIASAEAIFLSRGDQSGTNTKELSLWTSAASSPAGRGTRKRDRAWAQRSTSRPRSGAIRSATAGHISPRRRTWTWTCSSRAIKRSLTSTT